MWYKNMGTSFFCFVTMHAFDRRTDRKAFKIMCVASPCEAKKLHRFIFAIALSELHLLCQFLAHIYFNKCLIIRVFHILYIIRNREPA